MTNALVFDAMEFWRRVAPTRPAVIMDGVSIDYATLGRRTDAVAVKLTDAGVAPGDVVSISGVNSIEWVIAAVGAMKVGAILAPFNVRFVEAEIHHLLGFTEPKVVFVDAPRLGLFRRLCDGGPAVLPLEGLADESPTVGGWRRPNVDPDRPALLVFTSGSTGTPKGVMITHSNILFAFLERKIMEAAYRPGLRRFFALGLHGAPGVVWGMLSALTNGGSFYLHARFDAQAALDSIVRDRITVFTGVPIIFEQIAQLPGFEAADLSSLEAAQAGGAPVSASLLEAWRKKGVLMRQIYGMTEVSGLATVSTDDEVLAGAPTCGPGGVFTRLRIVDADGQDLPPGEAGEVLISGPTCTPGYWRDPGATADFIRDGWLHTGDRGVIDENGLFRYVDRMKDLIISGGYNISPVEIEAVACEFDPFAEVAVIGVADAKFGETPALCIHSVKPFETDELIAFVRARLADFKTPRYLFRHAEPLPRLSSGKIDKRLLRSQYADAASRFERVR